MVANLFKLLNTSSKYGLVMRFIQVNGGYKTFYDYQWNF